MGWFSDTFGGGDVTQFVDRAFGSEGLAGVGQNFLEVGTLGLMPNDAVSDLLPKPPDNSAAIAAAERQQNALLTERANQANRKDYTSSQMASMFFREQGFSGGRRSPDMLTDFVGL